MDDDLDVLIDGMPSARRNGLTLRAVQRDGSLAFLALKSPTVGSRQG